MAGNLASISFYIHKLGLDDLKIAATTKSVNQLAFGVRKDWPELQIILDKALQSISQTERDRIADSWINIRFSEKTDWTTIIWAGSAAALVVGIILVVIISWNRRMAKESPSVVWWSRP